MNWTMTAKHSPWKLSFIVISEAFLEQHTHTTAYTYTHAHINIGRDIAIDTQGEGKVIPYFKILIIYFL